MHLGVCYNLFDCEELLEASIRSVRGEVDFVVVVYQLTSNFGAPASPHLVDLLNSLKAVGLVDELIEYDLKPITLAQKEELVSPTAHPQELGGDVGGIGDQFFHELAKRERGRMACLAAHCTHFMSMDADEFYLATELATAKNFIVSQNIEASVCRMRTIGKFPTVEFVRDDLNGVPFIAVCRLESPLRLAAPYPMIHQGALIALDPTRRVQCVRETHYYVFERSEIEMWHMTLVRKDLRRKLENTSNRLNYGDLAGFLEKWNAWRPVEGGPVLHPHPYIAKLFTHVSFVSNHFNVDLDRQCRVCSKSAAMVPLQRCSICKSARYCSRECQLEDWSKHASVCQSSMPSSHQVSSPVIH